MSEGLSETIQSKATKDAEIANPFRLWPSQQLVFAIRKVLRGGKNWPKVRQQRLAKTEIEDIRALFPLFGISKFQSSDVEHKRQNACLLDP